MVVWRPGARPWSLHGLSMVSPWSLHGLSIEFPWSLHRISMVSPWSHRISIESPSRKHRLRSDEDPYIYTRCSESEGLSLRSESLKHQIKERIGDGGYPARSTAEGVGGLMACFANGKSGSRDSFSGNHQTSRTSIETGPTFDFTG